MWWKRRSVRAALIITALAGLGTVYCYARAAKLRTEGQYLMAKGNAEAEEYATTFDGTYADQQFATFESRREVLESAHLWQRLQMLLVMLTVISAFSTYILHLVAKIRMEVDDITDTA